MDAAARKLGIDPVELRRRNMIDPAQMPYTNAMGQVYDSGKFADVLDQGLALADWDGFAGARGGSRRRRGKLRGRGIATFLEWTGGNVFEERVTVAVNGRRRDRDLRHRPSRWARASPPATRSSPSTSSACRSRSIRIVLGDTDRGTGFGSAGSRSLFTAGSAMKVASDKTVATAQDLAAEALEAAAADIEYVAGAFRVAGTDRSIGLFDLAAKQPEQRIFIDSTSNVGGPTWPNGTHICEVEIDPDTGDGRDRLLRLGQRCRPRGQPDDRARPARRRRGAGPRPGAVRGGGLRPRIRPAAERQLHGLRAAARRHDRRLRHQARTSRSPA